MSPKTLFKFNGWTPKGWRKLDSDARSSTVAHFKGGYKCKSKELLVWAGTPNTHGTKYRFGGTQWREEPLLVEHANINDSSIDIYQTEYFKTADEANQHLKEYMKNNCEE